MRPMRESNARSTDARMHRVVGRFYYANRRDFLAPGIVVWLRGRNRRVIALPRR
ncbi:MAG TPA: hypothetical protein VG265_16570 [Gaiellaceae bacterium]|jgi:hypothetical protein|nr:hypothetical protein [Gaiellaceae bacterium]